MNTIKHRIQFWIKIYICNYLHVSFIISIKCISKRVMSANRLQISKANTTFNWFTAYTSEANNDELLTIYSCS